MSPAILNPRREEIERLMRNGMSREAAYQEVFGKPVPSTQGGPKSLKDISDDTENMTRAEIEESVNSILDGSPLSDSEIAKVKEEIKPNLPSDSKEVVSNLGEDEEETEKKDPSIEEFENSDFDLEN